MRLRPFLTVALIVSTLALSACQSAEERAEGHYQSALTLLEAGDTDRALVELRNVFDLNGFHKEARQLYAETVLARGEVNEAYGQYLRLIEQYPDTPDVRLKLAELAIQRNDWEEAERHGREALRLAPDLPGVAAVRIVLDYRLAVIDSNVAAAKTVADQARALLVTDPSSSLARRVLIDHLLTGDDPLSALPEIDLAIAAEPDAFELYDMKLRVLAQTDRVAEIGTHLQTMFDRFPDNEEVRGTLVNWYLSQGDTAGAEAILRRLAGEKTSAPEGHMAVLQLLQVSQGTEAVRAELETLITANTGSPNADLYRAMRAALDFEAGQQTEAMAEIETVIAAATPSDQTLRLKVMLARMLEASGDKVGARARIEEVLTEDSAMVDALKMRAGWLVAEDRPGDAIVDLRAALDQAPRDPEILTLMAQAHERDGAVELAGERLALAVEVSGRSVDTSLRYAAFLVQQDRAEAALAVLTDARQGNPASVPVLTQLADLHMAAQNWPLVEEIGATLRQIGTEDALEAEKALQTVLLLNQNRVTEGIAFLESQIGQGSDDLRAIAMVVQTQARAGKLDDARSTLDAELAKRPAETQLLLLSAGLHAMSGETAEAETILRDLIAKDPSAEAPARLLYGLLLADGRADEATVVLDAALAALPASGTLRWLKAGQLESAGDFEGAIAIYEGMYAENSADVVVANNLASLITTHRADPESLERAFVVARRLRGSDVPAFQDTYGWIEYRRGNLDEALLHLEPAAAGLPQDALTQFHLGMLYAALNRPEDARRQLTLALDIAGDSKLPQFDLARETLAALPPAP
ncbi:MAG: tetratricopeptide repeat protein [Rhodobacteraceae bacterium]|nr:tetratricopeptide repeat protein [Paracoccaceae bacterium]